MNTVAAIPLTERTGDQALQEGIDAQRKANLSPTDTLKYAGEAVGGGALAAGAALAAPTVLPAVGVFSLKHPFITAAAVHIGRELGVPVPKVLDIFRKMGGE